MRSSEFSGKKMTLSTAEQCTQRIKDDRKHHDAINRVIIVESLGAHTIFYDQVRNCLFSSASWKKVGFANRENQRERNS
jgi:hypothetical protein